MSQQSKTRKPRARASSASKTSAPSSDAAGAIDQATSLLEDASSVVRHVQSVKEHWQARAIDAAKHSPYLSLLGAGGAGFVLGGGVSIALTKRMWLIGGRIAISLALQRLTQGSLLGGAQGKDD